MKLTFVIKTPLKSPLYYVEESWILPIPRVGDIIRVRYHGLCTVSSILWDILDNEYELLITVKLNDI